MHETDSSLLCVIQARDSRINPHFHALVMKGSAPVYKRVLLLLIGLFAFQAAGASFAGASSYQSEWNQWHSVVKPFSTAHSFADTQLIQTGEEVSEDETMLWHGAVLVAFASTVSFYELTANFRLAVQRAAGTHLPLYLLHHCLRIPSQGQVMSC